MKTHGEDKLLIAFLVISACLFFLSLALPDIIAPGFSGPQPPLPKIHASFLLAGGGSPKSFDLEVANTPAERRHGEMFRQKIPDRGGMIFVWPTLKVRHMWMADCPVAEDMIFIADGRVVSIKRDAMPNSDNVISSHFPANEVVELKAGSGATIKVGDLFIPLAPIGIPAN